MEEETKGLIKEQYLVSHNLHGHLFEKVSRATRPSVLLITVSIESTWKFIFHLKCIR